MCLSLTGQKIIDAYPARVKFRGFDEETTDKGYYNVTKYLEANISELLKECESIEGE